MPWAGSSLASTLPILYSTRAHQLAEKRIPLPRAQSGKPEVAEPGSCPRHRRECLPSRQREFPKLVGGSCGMTYTFKLSKRLASNHLTRNALLALAVLTTACASGSGPTTSTPSGNPGWLTVQLTTPNSDDGALQLAVSGPTIDSIAAASPYEGFGVATGSNAFVLVAGSVTSGNVVRFKVPDVDRASQYTVTVQAVAQRGTYALRPTGAYQATIVR